MIVLGTGTIAFAAGKDGGRDAKFEGTAQRFPSSASPLAGKFIVQAKHTSNPVVSCSDREFSRILDSEVPKLKVLASDGELEHYLVFTNRRKPADKAVKKESDLKKLLSIKSMHILGSEQLRLWLTAQPQIWKNLGYDRYESRLEIQPADLTEVIEAFHATLKAAAKPEKPLHFPFEKKPRKNRINRLSSSYYEMIERDSLPHFKRIENFLKNPRNDHYRDLYEDSADEIKRKIIANGSCFDSFDEALTQIADLITDENPSLKGKRRFASIFLHYMYCTCDIGQHAKPVQTS
jgi:hypothetical protein